MGLPVQVPYLCYQVTLVRTTFVKTLDTALELLTFFLEVIDGLQVGTGKLFTLLASDI